MFSVIDPYHVGSPDDCLNQMDFTNQRKADAIKIITDALVEKPKTFPVELARQAIYTRNLESVDDPHLAAEIAIILSSETWSVLKRQKIATQRDLQASEQSIKKQQEYLSTYPGLKTHTESVIADIILKARDPNLRRVITIRSLESKVIRGLEHSLEKMINQFKEDNTDLSTLFRLAEVADNIYVNSVPVSEEAWRKMMDLIDTVCLHNPDFVSYLKSQKIEAAKPLDRFNDKTAYRLFRGHFDDPWKMGSPFAAMSQRDMEPVDSIQNNLYQQFRAKLLTAVSLGGLTGWTNLYDRNKKYPIDSGAQLFQSYLKSEMQQAGMWT